MKVTEIEKDELMKHKFTVKTKRGLFSARLSGRKMQSPRLCFEYMGTPNSVAIPWETARNYYESGHAVTL